MKKLSKNSIVGLSLALFIAFTSYVIFPKQTKSISCKLISSIKQVLSDRQNKGINVKTTKYQTADSLIWGIDISHHQREIEWEEIVKNKPHFVFLKSTEGSTHTDTKHKAYKKKFDELSIPSGSYHFFTYTSSGKAQAKHFLKNSNIKKGDLLPVLDVEFKNNMPKTEDVISNINEFIEHIVQELGVTPLIYCECDYYFRYLKDNLKSECQYWISDFFRTPKCDYVFWQKTDRFQHKAFKGTVDYNILKGTKSDLFNLSIK